MVQVTMQLSDELAERVQPMRDWLPTVLELSLVKFKTPATAPASEILQFLSTAPAPQAILNYHVSERAQMRLQRLLALNDAGLSGEEEQRELDELQHIEQIIILLKMRVAEQMQGHN